jgi:hypothetical protein
MNTAREVAPMMSLALSSIRTATHALDTALDSLSDYAYAHAPEMSSTERDFTHSLYSVAHDSKDQLIDIESKMLAAMKSTPESADLLEKEASRLYVALSEPLLQITEATCHLTDSNVRTVLDHLELAATDVGWSPMPEGDGDAVSSSTTNCTVLSTALLPASLLDDGYRLRRLLGHGVYGVVMELGNVDSDKQKEPPRVIKLGEISKTEFDTQTQFAKHGLAPFPIAFNEKVPGRHFGYLVMTQIQGTLRQWFFDPSRLAADFDVALQAVLHLIRHLDALGFLHADLHLSNLAFAVVDPGFLSGKKVTSSLVLLDMGLARTDGSCPFLEYIWLLRSTINMLLSEIPKNTRAQIALLLKHKDIVTIAHDDEWGNISDIKGKTAELAGLSDRLRQIEDLAAIQKRAASRWIRVLLLVMNREYPTSFKSAFAAVSGLPAAGPTFSTRLAHTPLRKPLLRLLDEAIHGAYKRLSRYIQSAGATERARMRQDRVLSVALNPDLGRGDKPSSRARPSRVR